ncbi:MAG: hypothetical protein ACRD5E_14475 [Nitrososphaeraceae archaeon]
MVESITKERVMIALSRDLIDSIKECINSYTCYRNPTEFITEATRLRLIELKKAKIDERKVEAFFLREKQIKDANLTKG